MMPETAAKPDPLYPPVIGVCGQSGSGKTLLIQQLVPRLIARGLCPAVVKRCTHRIEADRPGKDSDRVFQAGAEVLAAGPQESFARFHAEHMSIEECLRRVSGKCDLVLVEGCRDAAIPKIWLTQKPSEVPAVPGESLLVVPDASHGRAAEQAVWQVVERVHAGLRVLAAVLIGGRSRRMGSPKHLLKQEQVTLLERVVTAVGAHIADVVLIGTGEVPPSLLGLGRLPDAPGTEGPMAGVLSAMRWRPGARWLVLACDLAMITPDAVAWLLAQARPGLDAVMPVLPGRPTCEPLFAVYEPTARWFVELAAARGEFSLRRALQLGRVLQPQPPCDMQTAWTNVNTREEWRRIERPSSTRGNKLKDAQSMISLERALEVVLRAAPRLPSTEVRLEVAAGRVLAENVVSDVDLPPFKKSAMDGFAVRSEDIADVPAELRVVEDVPAGSVPRRATHSGECARIMTGAPVPEGADTVVMVEHTEPAGPGRVRILRAAPKGRNICLRGEDVKTGQTVLAEGTRLRPFQVALAAAVGRRSLRVSATPSVAVLATGDEVIEPDQTPRPGQIRNSNSYALAARLGQEGIWVDYLGIAVDDIAVLQAAFEKGMQRDVFVVSGGVSTGDYDLVPGALKDAGVELLFSEIAVQPGRPTVFGRRGRTMVFGLPGNPVSTLVIAELLLVPALRRMMGESNPSPLMIRAVLDGPLPHGGNRTSFRPVALRRSAEGWHAEPVVYHGSADLVGAARADAFAVVPADALELPAGSTVLALVFPLSLE